MSESGLGDVRLGPAPGAADSLLVFFHGYGSNGALMADHVGAALAQALPRTALRFPHGPFQMPYNPSLRGWYDAEDMIRNKDWHGIPFDGNRAAARAHAVQPDTHRYLDRVMTEENLPPARTIAAGFSQGGGIAFYAGLQRQEQLAGVASISGVAIDQVKGIASYPPLLIMAGENEPSLFSGRDLAEKTYAIALSHGFNGKAELYLSPGNDHNIDGNSLNRLAAFARRVLAPQPSVAPVPAFAPAA